jgi:hypothetical protein
MKGSPQTPGRPLPPTPAAFLAVAAALDAMAASARAADAPPTRQGTRRSTEDAPEPAAADALAALVLLRELRGILAEWEPALIETARGAGASWEALAGPLGVASRQAAERRYLRLRPGGADGSTGDQRVKATRDARAADRAVADWARGQSARLRSLAGQVVAVDGLGTEGNAALTALTDALGEDDAARLVAPLADTAPHLRDAHPELADRVRAVADRTDELRRRSTRSRRDLA